MSTQISSFVSAFEEYEVYASKRHKKQGYETHIRNLKLHVLPYFKDVEDIRLLEKKDIINWQNNILNKNFSNGFNSSLYYAFSSFIQFCMIYDYTTENIVLSVDNFVKKIEKKEHHVYNIFQFRKFRFHLKDYIEKQYFNFIFFCGTRPSEAMALKFDDIKRKNVSIEHSIQRRGKREIDTTKNQSSMRTIKVSWLMQYRIKKLKKFYLKKYGTFKSDYFVFGGQKPLSTSTIDRHKKIACEKAHMQEITQHEFRHSYATRLIHKGVPIDYVSRSMGHSKVSMTCDVYLHQEKRIPSIPFLRLFL